MKRSAAAYYLTCSDCKHKSKIAEALKADKRFKEQGWLYLGNDLHICPTCNLKLSPDEKKKRVTNKPACKCGLDNCTGCKSGGKNGGQCGCRHCARMRNWKKIKAKGRDYSSDEQLDAAESYYNVQ